jgi:hypothetical protein
MGTVSLVTIYGVIFVTFGSPYHRLPLQSLIGDWENGHFGDGKFPGFGAVSAIAYLRYKATVAASPEIGKVFSQAADNLTKSLGREIESFQRALDEGSVEAAA